MTAVEKDIREDIFIVAGMPRAGTTFLFHNLKKHPSIFVPFRKEVDYFSFYYGNGEDWYLDLFKEKRQGQMACDISPMYFFHDRAIERIQRFNSNAKVIVAVREPASFALSWHAHVQTFMYRVPPFAEFLQNATLTIGGEKIQVDLKKANGLPAMIKKFQDAFGDNLLIYSFDRFRRDRLFVMKCIESFVGLPSYFDESNFEDIVINAGKRRNIKGLTYLMSRKTSVSLMKTLVPRGALNFLREKYDLWSRPRQDPSAAEHAPEDVRLAETLFAEERAFFEEFFRENEIQLGSGRPFSWKEVRA